MLPNELQVVIVRYNIIVKFEEKVFTVILTSLDNSSNHSQEEDDDWENVLESHSKCYCFKYFDRFLKNICD